MALICKLAQHFEFHSGISSLTITSISKDAPFVQNLDGLMDPKYASLFVTVSGGWKTGQDVDDITLLQCISSIREKGWGLLCNDVINVEPGWALRTFFFEMNIGQNSSILTTVPNPTAPSNGLDNTKLAASSWATIAAAPAPVPAPPLNSVQRRISYSDLGNSAASVVSNPTTALPPPPPPVSTTKALPPPPPAPTRLAPPPPKVVAPAPAPSPASPTPVAVARTAPPPTVARPPPPPAPVLTAEQKAEKERQAEFFRAQVKDKEEKEAAKQNKMTPEEREAQEEKEKAASAHEADKTRHFARLGRLAGGGAKLAGRGPAGRGGGRGRGR